MRCSQTARIGGFILGLAVAIGFAPAARAETPATPGGDAGVCMADPGIALDQINLVNQIKAQAEAAAKESGADGDVVELNTDGYRYGDDGVPALVRDLQVLDIEVRRARAAAQREGRL